MYTVYDEDIRALQKILIQHFLSLNLKWLYILLLKTNSQNCDLFDLFDWYYDLTLFYVSMISNWNSIFNNFKNPNTIVITYNEINQTNFVCFIE